ncbi:hypothetical protein TTHERM_00355110 (macronuclear) [Tetrahymena thermophila SB210]|uniref:Uncharacterized protein n=1 Tax=Tetrahymena thermophila (strain SB210) TaxID=312017 RepID=Q22Y60_TETTS|nr:hypothetical protein TTHERM_00355110 [Tetrahymena thermophila SB210]EAR90164.3 hypothetical protein TTHERM_00355110 [Tetrahymena thermophila SB210]|eukprot:XP_001010409.3 hypothetical protein TTHERM_00355110 [Tetrahymena thermophila SB210]
MKNLDNVFFEDLEDMLKLDNKANQARPQSQKPSTSTLAQRDRGFQQAAGGDDDIQFFEDNNDFFGGEQRQKSSTLQKFDRKMDVRSNTTVDFTKTRKDNNEFDELLGNLDNKSNFKPSSGISQKNMQGQYNQSQVNYFQDLNDDIDDDFQKKSQMGMTGMTIQTTYSKNEDNFLRMGSQQQSQQHDFKRSQDHLNFENKNDDLDLDMPFSRRNPRRAETQVKSMIDDDNQRMSIIGSSFKPPIPSGSMFVTTSQIIGSKDPMQPFNKKIQEQGYPSTRSRGKDDDNILSVLEEEEDQNKNPFGKGMSFGVGSQQKQQYPFAGGIFDANPTHSRVKSQDQGSEKGSQIGNSKKITQQNDLEDALEGCDYNPSSASRLAASKRPRTSQKENQSQPGSMNNTMNNINPSVIQSQAPKSQVYPRLMKSPDDPFQSNINSNNNNILNESVGTQQKYNRSQGNKNESSYISDKDLYGGSETKEGPQQFDENNNLDINKFSRRSSYMRGGAAPQSADNKNSGQIQPHSAFFQNSQQNQGPLSDIPDLKMSETNFQQNQINSNYGSEKTPADPKQFQKQNQEEISLKLLKQMEEERKNMRIQITKEHDEDMKKLKVNYEDQIKSIKENYEQLLKFEKDRNQQLQDEMKELIIKDRERQRQLFDIEVESLKNSFEKEKAQIIMSHQIQSESLKKQLQQQAEIIGLAEQLKQNSEKLNSISYQIETTQERNQIDMQKLNNEVQEKQKYLKDLESRLKLEQEFIDSEKRRLDKLKSDIQQTEESQRGYLDKEKAMIRTEYTRLNELQDQIKEIDAEKKREIAHERNKMETERLEIQEERIKLKEEYERMYKEFELKVNIFEQTKMELQRSQTKMEYKQQQQIKEIEQKHIDLLKQEQIILQKTKLLELREYELKQQEQQSNQYFRQVATEKANFDSEKQGLRVLADKIEAENQGIREFKANFDLERMKLIQKEQELQDQEKNIRRKQEQVLSEKREVTQLQDTLRNLRSNFVKGLVNSPPNSLTLAPSLSSFISPNKSSATNQFGFRSPQNQFLSSQRTQQNQDVTFRSPESKLNKIHIKEVERELAFQNSQKNEGYVKQVMHERFDLKGFMNQIREIDQKQMSNVGYIMNEKDNLYTGKTKDRFPTFNFYENEQHSQSERSINAHSYIEN